MELAINGPQIYFTIPIFGGIDVTETMVVSLLVSLVLIIGALILRMDLKLKSISKKQSIAEIIVNTLYKLVEDTMGKKYSYYTPYIGTLFMFIALSSLAGLFALRPPTADMNVTFTLAGITFILIQYTGLKTKKVKGYFKSFTEPVPFLLPINLLSELSTPISMAFRLFGNIFGGLIVTTLIYGALGAFLVFTVPIFQVGLPAVLSLYFDLFTSVLQAFVFSMLTMVFVSMADAEN